MQIAKMTNGNVVPQQLVTLNCLHCTVGTTDRCRSKCKFGTNAYVGHAINLGHRGSFSRHFKLNFLSGTAM